MNRIPTTRALAIALLGTVLAAGAVLPASAFAQDGNERPDRPQRQAKRSPQQAERANREAGNDGDRREVHVAPQRADDRQRDADRGEQRRQQMEVQRMAQQQRDDGQREQQRQQMEIQRLARQQRDDGQREQQRQRIEVQRMAQQQRDADQREQQRQQMEVQRMAQQQRVADQREQQRQQMEVQRMAQQQRIAGQREQQRRVDEARSPQAQIIAEARQREARGDGWQDRPPPRPGQHDDRRDNRPDWRGHDNRNRISRDQQQRRIEEQRRQQAQWQREEANRRAQYDRQRRDLDRQRRIAQSRYQQDYWRRWQAEQARRSTIRFDYYNDPFFYTPYNYRYSYGGRWYSTNSYGAQLLEQAIRDGYREGWYAGQADRADRWRFDYGNNYGYLDGSFGYYGSYVGLDDYRYYFRQGFERGYRDGYYGRYQYGRYENGGAMILPAILGMILAFSIDR